MAYRFTYTGKWNDEWFVDLKPLEKLTFMYLCDNCDIGGFYELSMRKLRFDLGFTDTQIKDCFKGLQRGFVLSTDKRILFLKNFLKHQKNIPLNPNNKAHRGILYRFENYKSRFDIDLLKLVNKEINPCENEGALKGLLSPTGIGNNIIKEIRENKGVDFQVFWDLYDKKKGDKRAVERKWNNLSVTKQKKIIEILPKWKKQYDDINFLPFPQTFLNQERWNDELSSPVIVQPNGTFQTNVLTAPEKVLKVKY